MPVPSRAADGDGAGAGGVARRDVTDGHLAIDTLAGILNLDAITVRRIADLAPGTLHRCAAGGPVHTHVVHRTAIAVVGEPTIGLGELLAHARI